MSWGPNEARTIEALWILIRERKSCFEELGHFIFFSGFGFQTYEQCNCEHRVLPIWIESRADKIGLQRPEAIGKNAKNDIIFAMRIIVLALDGVFDTGLATVLDAFQTANELAEMSGLASPRFDVTIAGMRKSVKTSQGLTVPVCAAPTRTVPDWVVVPAIGYKMPGPLEKALARSDVSDAGKALRAWAKRGASTAAACIGTFVPAESGLLDDQDSTTTWWLAPLFRQRYPKVRVDESRMIVKSGKFVTAGAALSHMDLALWLIRQKSPKLAALTAKYLVAGS